MAGMFTSVGLLFLDASLHFPLMVTLRLWLYISHKRQFCCRLVNASLQTGHSHQRAAWWLTWVVELVLRSGPEDSSHLTDHLTWSCFLRSLSCLCSVSQSHVGWTDSGSQSGGCVDIQINSVNWYDFPSCINKTFTIGLKRPFCLILISHGWKTCFKHFIKYRFLWTPCPVILDKFTLDRRWNCL